MKLRQARQNLLNKQNFCQTPSIAILLLTRCKSFFSFQRTFTAWKSSKFQNFVWNLIFSPQQENLCRQVCKQTQSLLTDLRKLPNADSVAGRGLPNSDFQPSHFILTSHRKWNHKCQTNMLISNHRISNLFRTKKLNYLSRMNPNYRPDFF